MKRSTQVVMASVFALSSAISFAGPGAGANCPPAGQSAGTANRLAAQYGGGWGYAPRYTPGLAYRNSRLDITYQQTIRKLASQVQQLTGSRATEACKAFRTVGDCVAAAHASNNLGLNFASLRRQMTHSYPHQQLDTAIENLKPDADAKSEATKAREQAKSDIEG